MSEHSGSTAIDLAVSTVIFALRPAPGGGAPTLWIPLVRRIREPHEGLWALPGGRLRPEEALGEAARRNLKETIDLEPKYLEQLYAFGDPERSLGDRVVSIVYWALVHADQADRVAEGENVRWSVADELPELAFDHNVIVDYALWRLRNKVEYSRIAHALIGEPFTLSQLRGVHEAILRKPIDPANFRRQMEASGGLVATTAVVTGGRHRPPRLYRYNDAIDMADNGPLGPRAS